MGEMSTLTVGQNIKWYRGFIQGKTRITLAWAFAFLLGFSAREYPTWPGIVLCFLGASLRFWASGYLRKDSRPAVGGPYAFIRNPLYLGTYLMALGTAWATENWILLGTLTVAFAAIYHYIILDEEVKLRRIFQGAYVEYCQSVPRFFPRLWPLFGPASRQVLREINPESAHHSFSFSLAMKNKAYEAYATFLGLIAFVGIVAFCWKQFS
jgi:protein-S-isoprenylcysteine O-methyltransferase Ste14